MPDVKLVAQLMTRGGWDLDDAQARHRANPESFWLPPEDELRQLAPGHTARLIFRLVDQCDPVRDGVEPYGDAGAPNLTVQCERMWLWVERVEGEELVGVLRNLPVSTHTRLLPGARVRFRRRDVIDLDLETKTPMAEEFAAMAECGFPLLSEAEVLAPEDPRREPSIPPRMAAACQRVGARPERPWDFSRLLLGAGVQPGVFPVYGGRFPPNREKGDCGWAIWTGDPDMANAAKLAPFELVEVGRLYERHREAWSHLALPPGWAFVLGPDGKEDVYRDEGLLE